MVPLPPRRWARLRWLGPGFLWMLSAAGSGEVLFTPRVAALYGYSLLWALLGAVTLKWFINREIGRFTTCTGATILDGFSHVPGPKAWAMWLILVPQLVVAVATVAGLAGTAAAALQLMIGGPLLLWSSLVIVAGAAVVLFGGYGLVEKLAAALGVALTGAVVAAAGSVFPPAGELLAGLVPRLNADVNVGEVLPWLGFMLAGAAGLMWFSYWVDARGYGAAGSSGALSADDVPRLRGWISLVTLTNTLAVIGALVMALAFLILGGELLRPRGLVPEEERVAETLGRLLGDVWGPLGFWAMIVAIFVTFCSTTLSVQDGFARMFGDGLRLSLRLTKVQGGWAGGPWPMRIFTMVVLVIAPIGVYAVLGRPVASLQVAGAIEAAQIPLVAALTLYLNKHQLPGPLQPSRVSFWMTMVASVFFAAFATLYFARLFAGAGQT